MDVSNAFDTLNHTIPLSKVDLLNILLSLNTWLTFYRSSYFCGVSFNGWISYSFLPPLVSHKVPFWIDYYFISSQTILKHPWGLCLLYADNLTLFSSVAFSKDHQLKLRDCYSRVIYTLIDTKRSKMSPDVLLSQKLCTLCFPTEAPRTI